MLTRIALKFRVITLLILALVIASGIWSASKLQLELLPDVEFPLFTVFTYYEDGAPQDVLDDVTIPLESIAAELEGVDNYVSTSSPMARASASPSHKPWTETFSPASIPVQRFFPSLPSL